jgi:hypothetical protein
VEDGRILLRADGYAPEGIVKTPQLEGPIGDVTTTARYRRGDDLRRPGGAASLPRRRRPPNRWLGGRPAREAAPPSRHGAVGRRRGPLLLVLIGGPEANAVTRRLIDRLPLRMEGERVTIDGQTFDAPGAAVGLVYPNPLNVERYVAVCAATAPRRRPCTRRHDPGRGETASGCPDPRGLQPDTRLVLQGQ